MVLNTGGNFPSGIFFILSVNLTYFVNLPVVTYKQTPAGNLSITVNTGKKGSDAKLEIFDLHGRLLKRTELDGTDSGVSTLTWNSRNKNGDKTANALLLLRYKDSVSTATVKVLVK